MNIEFFMGVLAAIIIPKLPEKIAATVLITGILLFAISAVYSANGGFVGGPVFNRVILYGIPSFLIITGIVKYELSRQLKVHSFFVTLGEASYSLYLLHLPLVVAALKIGSKFLHSGAILIQIFALGTIILICIVSIFFYRWIEKPMITRINFLLNKYSAK